MRSFRAIGPAGREFGLRADPGSGSPRQRKGADHVTECHTPRECFAKRSLKILNVLLKSGRQIAQEGEWDVSCAIPLRQGAKKNPSAAEAEGPKVVVLVFLTRFSTASPARLGFRQDSEPAAERALRDDQTGRWQARM